MVNQRFETNVPDVYAAGDVANFFDPLFDKQRRIEHWSNANYQGTEVGKVLAGAEGGYDTVSTFFTEVFGHDQGLRRRQARLTGRRPRLTRRRGSLRAVRRRREETIGALSVGQTEEVEELLKQQVRARAPLRAIELEGRSVLGACSTATRRATLEARARRSSRTRRRRCSRTAIVRQSVVMFSGQTMTMFQRVMR